MQRKGSRNKTATLPARAGTGSGHTRFVERALAARDEAQRTGEYFTADEVLRELDELHARALAGPGK